MPVVLTMLLRVFYELYHVRITTIIIFGSKKKNEFRYLNIHQSIFSIYDRNNYEIQFHSTDRAISEKWISRAKSLQGRDVKVLKHRNNFMKYFLGLIRQTISETGQSPTCCGWGVSGSANRLKHVIYKENIE
jgi:hypothetical protein